MFGESALRVAEGAVPDCVTVKAIPATVSMALRELAPLFCATV